VEAGDEDGADSGEVREVGVVMGVVYEMVMAGVEKGGVQVWTVAEPASG